MDCCITLLDPRIRACQNWVSWNDKKFKELVLAAQSEGDVSIVEVVVA